MVRYLLQLSIFLLAGCRYSIYSPQVAPPIAVEKAGEVQVDMGLSGPTSGGHFNIAYALSDAIALQLGARVFAEDNQYFNGSIGYSKVGNSESRSGIFAGFETGEGINSGALFPSMTHYSISGSSRLIYLQPQFITKGKKTDFAFSTRFGLINQRFNFFERKKQRYTVISEIDEERELDTFFIEPSISFIKSLEEFNVVITCSYNINFGFEEEQGGIKPFNTAISLQYIIGSKK